MTTDLVRCGTGQFAVCANMGGRPHPSGRGPPCSGYWHPVLAPLTLAFSQPAQSNSAMAKPTEHMAAKAKIYPATAAKLDFTVMKTQGSLLSNINTPSIFQVCRG